MTPFSFKDLALENELIGNILREYPRMSRIMERYFGGIACKGRALKSRRSGWLASYSASLRRGCLKNWRIFGTDRHE